MYVICGHADFQVIIITVQYFVLYLSLSFQKVSGGEDEIQQLQKALLDYLDENTETDASLVVNFSFLGSSVYENSSSNVY